MSFADPLQRLANPYAQQDQTGGSTRSGRAAKRALAAGALGLGATAVLAGTGFADEALPIPPGQVYDAAAHDPAAQQVPEWGAGNLEAPDFVAQFPNVPIEEVPENAPDGGPVEVPSTTTPWDDIALPPIPVSSAPLADGDLPIPALVTFDPATQEVPEQGEGNVEASEALREQFANLTIEEVSEAPDGGLVEPAPLTAAPEADETVNQSFDPSLFANLQFVDADGNPVQVGPPLG